jgi:hypothetical protein
LGASFAIRDFVSRPSPDCSDAIDDSTRELFQDLPFATRELSPCFFRRSFDTTGDTQRLPPSDCALDKLAL